MDFLTEIILDRLILLDARKNALRFKKMKTNIVDDEILVTCQLKNSHKDYLVIFFPVDTIESSKSGINVWNWSNVSPQTDLIFKTEQKKGQKPKAKLLDQDKMKDCFKLVLKPNKTMDLIIKVPKEIKKRNMKFELGFRRKQLNSKVYLKRFKI